MADEPQIERIWQTPSSGRVDELFAWVCTEPDGSEGLLGGNVGPGGQWIAFVGGDLDRMRSLRSFAETTRRATGWPVRLLRFSRREELEELA